MPPTSGSRTLHWDGTIAAGHVLSGLAMLAAVLGVWFRLDAAVQSHADRIRRLEASRERDDRETAVNMAAFAALKANQEAMLASQLRTERAIEALAARMDQSRPPQR